MTTEHFMRVGLSGEQALAKELKGEKAFTTS